MKFRLGAVAAAAWIGACTWLSAAPAHADSIHIAGTSTTYYTLSQYYRIGINELMQANPSVHESNIYPGLKLSIPGTASAKTVAAQSTTEKEIISASLNVTPAAKTVEAWGKSFSYSKVLQVKATAYSSAASENGGWGPVDYFGNPLKLGTIAVDPSVIPFGTKVLVTGHSHAGLPKQAFIATATDAGSAIKGNRIDIFIPGSQSFVSDFGFQYVNLYFVE
ncbi:3D domain-containing protein [Paenibacillus tengchongensis]|uniref:3D domain-containing protein n=1 Tax=Paenibacillus tengchongensis TaxID=2608684 RepID=UPI00124BEB58|nr:3D domain-containing protein [Paenibacillus tengchongensis]